MTQPIYSAKPLPPKVIVECLPPPNNDARHPAWKDDPLPRLLNSQGQFLDKGEPPHYITTEPNDS